MKQYVEKKSIKVNYIYSMIYQILLVLAPLITTPYVSRVLQSDGIGSYSYTVSIANLFSIFGSLGFTTYGQLQIARARNDAHERSKIFWEIIIVKSFCMTITEIVYLIFMMKSSQYRLLFFIEFQTIITYELETAWFLEGLEEFKKTVSRNFIIKLQVLFLFYH
jgi:O-antigen/teichoic acid export membrane protein